MFDISPLAIGLIGFVLAIGLIIIGIPVWLPLMSIGFFGIIVATGNFSTGVTLLRTTPYGVSSMISLVVVPLFILMGHLTLHGGITARAFTAAYKWLGKLPGGLLIAVTWANVAFGAVSGSSIAAASIFTKITIPEIDKLGYSKGFACGGIATASIIAMLIPPSIFSVIYAMLAEQNVGMVLIAGALPGILLATLLSLGIMVRAIINPHAAPKNNVVVPLRDKIISLPQTWPIIALILIIVGGIYTGIFSPNEAAGVGALVAFIFALIYRRLTFNNLKESILDTARMTGMLFLIIISANIFSRFLAISGFTVQLAKIIAAADMNYLMFLVVAAILYLFLGCFLDAISIMVLTLPIFLPALNLLGIDPIHFGVIVVASVSVGMITPPFGLVVYATKAAAGSELSVESVFRGTYPYFVMLIICLAFLIVFPQISLLLPTKMIGG